MGIRDWFGGKTYARSSTEKSTGVQEKSVHSLEGTPESHDHKWVRTDNRDGLGRTVMGETGRNSVARDEGRSADRRGSRGGNADRDRERR